MSPLPNIWKNTNLTVSGKWGEIYKTYGHEDRQVDKGKIPSGTFARMSVLPYSLLPDSLLIVKAFAKFALVKHGISIVQNFCSKSGSTMRFEIDSWSSLFTSKDQLIEAIKSKIKETIPFGSIPFACFNVNVDKEIQGNLPSFGFAPGNISEMLEIGGIQEVNISSSTASVSEGFQYWDRRGHIHNKPDEAVIRLTFLFRDWFGVDEGDFASTKWTAILDGEALACFWILQHQRGYPPFITEWTYKTDITVEWGKRY